MLPLLLNGQVTLFTMIIIALIISLTFHELGHAYTAKLFGDDTAEKLGRISLNPLVHLDVMGLLMVVFIGFGYAKPVPVNPRKFNSPWADLFISAAGPFMNLVLAVIAINIYVLARTNQWSIFDSPNFDTFIIYFSSINMLLMLFNLLPIGSLDGHHILPYFLPKNLAKSYLYWNSRFGNYFLLLLVVASFAGFPVFQYLSALGRSLLPYIDFVS